MKLNFIKDTERNLEADDLLGTKPYVNTLVEIVEKAKEPFTIGLFGGWGTGKSSIIKTIESKYNDDESSETKVFVYDAWKYSEDSFRRTFILELQKKFKLEKGADYQNFYNDKHEDIEYKNKFDNKKSFLGLLYLLPLVFLIVWIIPDTSMDLQLSLSAIAIISTIIFYFLKDVYVQYKISVTRPKTFAPEQFENSFTDAIQSITKKESIFKWFKFGDKTVHANRLVIVIDNIDRCHKKLAFELLLTVKTFLEQKDKKIIFILPIDENEIKKHINKEGHDGNEFLRKLFNTTLTIKKFSEDDLFDFTKSLQKKHKLELNDDVLSLISQEFSRSPRKIIQFLNVLQTEVKLAEEQEKKGTDNKSNFKKGYITENIEFLVKVLLIREEWTNLYNQIKENPFLLDDINEQIDDGVEKVVYKKDKKENIILTTEQKRFLESTRYISATNSEAFFSNKDAFPEFPDDLPKLVLTQDWETVKTKYLEKDIFELNKLLSFIDALFRREVIKRKLKGSSFNIFSFLFKIAEDEKYKEELLKCFYSNGKPLLDIKSKLNGNNISNIILDFNPVLLLNFVKTDLNENSRLLQEVINIINNKENDDGNRYNYLLTKFVNEFKNDEFYLQKIGVRFSEILKEYPDVFDDFKDILKNTVVVEALIKEDILEEFIKNLEQDPDTENVKMKVKIIKQYNLSKGLRGDLLKQYIEKIVSFLNTTNDLKIVSFWFKELSSLKDGFVKNDISSTVFAMLNSKYQTLYGWFVSYPDDKNYKLLLECFINISSDLYIGDQLSQEDDDSIKIWLKSFFNRTEYKFGWLYANANYFKIVQKSGVMDWDFAQNVIDKFNQLPEWKDKTEIVKTLNLMLSKTTEEKGLSEVQIQTILGNYINNISIDEDSVQLWLSLVIKNPVVKVQLVKVVSELGPDDKLDVLNIIKKLDKSLLKNSVEEIISETESDNLDENFKKLDNSDIGPAIINNGIEKAIKNLQQENAEDYFKKFLGFIVDREKLPENIRVAIVNKISLFLHDEKTREEKIFALQILDKITFPKSKKTLIKELLRDLNVNNFDDEGKKLFIKIKKKVI